MSSGKKTPLKIDSLKMILGIKPPAPLVALACLILASLIPSGSGFDAAGGMKRSHPRKIQINPNLLSSRVAPGWIGGRSRRSPSIVSIEATPDPDTQKEVTNGSDSTAADNFDAEGFANYLLPYALALIGSIVVTGAVFKFVLLDY